MTRHRARTSLGHPLDQPGRPLAEEAGRALPRPAVSGQVIARPAIARPAIARPTIARPTTARRALGERPKTGRR
jgi:hypothetical protein